MHSREIEMTYIVDASLVRSVYDAFAGPPSHDADRPFTARAKPPRTVLHFYLTANEGVSVRRLRARHHHGTPLIRLDSKRVLHEDDLLIEKNETIENPCVPLALAAEMLSREAAVLSSFIKNQSRLELRQGPGSLKVSVDQMIPFRADQPTVLGSQFWHLEIEEIRNWPLAAFHESEFFKTYLSDIPRLLQSKWQSAMLSPPVAIDRASRYHFQEYLDELIALGQKHLINPPLQGYSNNRGVDT